MERTIRIATDVLAIVVFGLFAFLAVRGIYAPESASRRFGIAISGPDGAAFFRVFLSRNLVIVVTATIFLVFRLWRPLAILMTVVVALPLFDMTLLFIEQGQQAPWSFHFATACIVAVLAALLWMRAR